MPPNEPKNKLLHDHLDFVNEHKSIIFKSAGDARILGSNVSFEDPEKKSINTLSLVELPPGFRLKLVMKKLEFFTRGLCADTAYYGSLEINYKAYCPESQEEKSNTMYLRTQVAMKLGWKPVETKGQILRLDNADRIHRLATADIRYRLVCYEKLADNLRDLYKKLFPIEKLQLKDLYFFEPIQLSDQIKAGQKTSGYWEDPLKLFDMIQNDLQLIAVPNFIEARFLPEMFMFERADETKLRKEAQCIFASAFISLVLSIECEFIGEPVKVEFVNDDPTAFMDNFECPSYESDVEEEKKLNEAIRQHLREVEEHRKNAAVLRFEFAELPFGTYEAPEKNTLRGIVDGGVYQLNQSLQSNTISSIKTKNNKQFEKLLMSDFDRFWEEVVKPLDNQTKLISESPKQNSLQGTHLNQKSVTRLHI